MNRVPSWFGSSAWWLLPLAVAATILGWETDWGRHLRPEATPAEPVLPKPVVISVLPDYTVAGGLAARPETTGRTLFNPTRRPAPPVFVEAPKPTMKRGQFTLTGTLVVDGKSTAFLREVAGGKARRVLQGESINGLLVAEVKPDRVKLTMGDESEDLILKVQPNPTPTVAAAPAPPVPSTAVPSEAAAAGVTAGPVVTPLPGATGTELVARRRAAREAAAAAAATAEAPPAADQAAPATAAGTPSSPRQTSWEDVARRYREQAEQRKAQPNAK